MSNEPLPPPPLTVHEQLEYKLAELRESNARLGLLREQKDRLREAIEKTNLEIDALVAVRAVLKSDYLTLMAAAKNDIQAGGLN